MAEIMRINSNKIKCQMINKKKKCIASSVKVSYINEESYGS